MEDNAISNMKVAFLEYEKPGLPKRVNNKYKVISYGDPNDVVYVNKEDLPSFSDNFVTHLVLDNVQEAQVEEDGESSLDEGQDKRLVWDDKATRVLLSLYKQKERLLRSGKLKSRKQMWESISARFAKLGYSYSAVQVQNRFKTLLRAWRTENLGEPLIGRKRKIFEYREELDSMYNSLNLPEESMEDPDDQVGRENLKQNEDASCDSDSSHEESPDVRQKKEWSTKPTILLISLYKKNKRLLGLKFRSKKEVFERISVEMGNRGYSFSALQIENRFKTLLRSYRKTYHDENKNTTRLDQAELEETFLKDCEVASEDDEPLQPEVKIDQEEEFRVTLPFQHVELTEEIANSDGTFKKVEWDDAATQLLLTLYKKNKPLVETRKIKSKKEMWESISAIFNRCGYLFSPIQIDNRFKTILRGYKKFLQTGKRPLGFIYHEELDAIFMDDDDMFSETITDAERTILKRTISERLGLPMDAYELEVEENEEPEELNPEKKSVDENALQEIRRVLEASDRRAAKRHWEIIKFMKESNEIQMKRNEILEKYLKLQTKK